MPSFWSNLSIFLVTIANCWPYLQGILWYPSLTHMATLTTVLWRVKESFIIRNICHLPSTSFQAQLTRIFLSKFHVNWAITVIWSWNKNWWHFFYLFTFFCLPQIPWYSGCEIHKVTKKHKKTENLGIFEHFSDTTKFPSALPSLKSKPSMRGSLNSDHFLAILPPTWIPQDKMCSLIVCQSVGCKFCTKHSDATFPAHSLSSGREKGGRERGLCGFV